MLQPENCRNPELICCCWGVIAMLKQFTRLVEHHSSNYYAVVDTNLYIGCETCENRCRMDAISVADEKAFVDTGRCIGCGLCTSGCQTGAVTL